MKAIFNYIKIFEKKSYTNNNCKCRLITKNCINPYIIIREDDIIQKLTIFNKFTELLANALTTCKTCG